MTQATRGPFSPLVERALRVAAVRHRGQNRKGAGLPYVTHPAHVALLLVRAGFDDDAVLSAALLHDVVEDTDYTAADVRREFPSRVADYVDALSEEKRDSAGAKRPWEVRKREHLAQVAAAPLEARAIVLADKLHNLGTMLYDLDAGEDVWGRFNAGPDRVIWYHREMVRAAGEDPRLKPLAYACRECIDELERRRPS